MIDFIDDHRGAYGVEPICEILPVAPSSYREHVAKRCDPARLSARVRRNLELKPEVARVIAENYAVYGAQGVARGHPASRGRGGRLCRPAAISYGGVT